MYHYYYHNIHHISSFLQTQPPPVVQEPVLEERQVATQERRSRRIAGAGLGTPHALPVRTRRRRLHAVSEEEPGPSGLVEEAPVTEEEEPGPSGAVPEEEEEDETITWRCVICLRGIRSEKEAHILFPCRHTNIHSMCAYQQIIGAETNTCGTCRSNIEEHKPLSDWLQKRAQIAIREALASTYN